MAVLVLSACAGGAGDVALMRSEMEPERRTPTSRTPTTPVGQPDVAAEPALDPIPVAASSRRARAGPRAARASVEPTGHIEIPAIGLSHPTYEGIDLSTINRGPSHWPGSALPGERGNTVFPGHRTTYSRPFWDIQRLRAGDEVIFTTPAGRFTYRVTKTFVVSSRDTWIIEPTDHASFTIFACHPRGSARQRYVAKGDLVSAPAPTTTTTTEPRSTTTEPAEDERRIGDLLPD